jgi:quinol monooxygenase YgiN
MYARAITFKYQPGKIDEALHLLRETVVPELQQQPGFQGATNLVDRDANKVIGITLWKTNTALQDSGMSKLQARFAVINSLLAAPPVVEVYEVTDDQRC